MKTSLSIRVTLFSFFLLASFSQVFAARTSCEQFLGGFGKPRKSVLAIHRELSDEIARQPKLLEPAPLSGKEIIPLSPDPETNPETIVPLKPAAGPHPEFLPLKLADRTKENPKDRIVPLEHESPLEDDIVPLQYRPAPHWLTRPFIARSENEKAPKWRGLLTPHEATPWRWYHYPIAPLAFPFWWTNYALQAIPRQFGYKVTPGNFLTYNLSEAPIRWLTDQPYRLRKWITVPIAIVGSLYTVGEVTDAAVKYFNKTVIDEPLADYVKDLIEENAAVWDRHIESDYAYHSIKVRLDAGKISKAKARQEAFNMNRALEHYLKILNEDDTAFEDNAENWEHFLKYPFFNRVKRLIDGHGKEEGYRFAEGFNPNLTHEQKAALMQLTHEKMLTFQRIESWITKLERNEPLTEAEKKWVEGYTDADGKRVPGYMEDPLLKHLLLTLLPPEIKGPGIPEVDDKGNKVSRGYRLLENGQEVKDEYGQVSRRYLTPKELIYWMQYWQDKNTKQNEDRVVGRIQLRDGTEINLCDEDFKQVIIQGIRSGDDAYKANRKAEYEKKKQKEKEAHEQKVLSQAPHWEQEIESNPLYLSLKEQKAEGKMKELPLYLAASKLKSSQDAYHDTVKSYPEILKKDPENWDILIQTPLFKKVKQYFEAGAKEEGYSYKPGFTEKLSEAQKGALVDSQHSRLNSFQNIDSWIAKASKNEALTEQEKAWANELQNSPFVKYLMQKAPKEMGGNGELSKEQLSFWLKGHQEADFERKEDEILLRTPTQGNKQISRMSSTAQKEIFEKLKAEIK